MIQGLRTVIYPVADLAEGKAWYGRVLEREPVLRRAVLRRLLGRRVRAGADPRRRAEPAGVHAFWGVPDAAAELARLDGPGGTRSMSRSRMSAAASRSRRCRTRSATSSASSRTPISTRKAQVADRVGSPSVESAMMVLRQLAGITWSPCSIPPTALSKLHFPCPDLLISGGIVDRTRGYARFVQPSRAWVTGMSSRDSPLNAVTSGDASDASVSLASTLGHPASGI